MRLLLEQGFDVTVVDDLSKGHRHNVPDGRLVQTKQSANGTVLRSTSATYTPTGAVTQTLATVNTDGNGQAQINYTVGSDAGASGTSGAAIPLARKSQLR